MQKNTSAPALILLALLLSAAIGPLFVYFYNTRLEQSETQPTEIISSPAPTPSARLTSTPTVTPTPPPPTPALPPTAIPIPEGMVLIPAGYFQMGSSSGQALEIPEHPVLLDAYYLDQFEVSNAQYRACVSAGACTASPGRGSVKRASYRDAPAYDNYPVINVSWDQASAFCAGAGKRLPTEAEWEYAASGPDNLIWPWGDSFDLDLSAATAPDTQPVDSYPGGVSPFGVFNLAGNVSEWTQDGYDPAFYANSPARNPVIGVGSDATRVYRGGSFDNLNRALYTTYHRELKNQAFSALDLGFRCALDAVQVRAGTPPEEQAALAKDFCGLFVAYKPEAACP